MASTLLPDHDVIARWWLLGIAAGHAVGLKQRPLDRALSCVAYSLCLEANLLAAADRGYWLGY
jgi:hypothetical protein